MEVLSIRHLPIQSEQWKHQNNLRNISIVDNKNNRTTSMIFIVNFEQIYFSVASLLTLNK